MGADILFKLLVQLKLHKICPGIHQLPTDFQKYYTKLLISLV
jgi:hypothetical protein